MIPKEHLHDDDEEILVARPPQPAEPGHEGVRLDPVEDALAEVPWAQMLLTVHDELIFECDDERVDDLVKLARPLMEGAFALRVPLRVDAGHGHTWAQCKG